jgi:hypothetical protein
MTRFLRLSAAMLFVTAVIVPFAMSCGGSGDGDDDPFPRVVTLGEGDVFASVVNSSLTTGSNRMLLKLSDADGEPIFGATVHLRFFDLTDEEPRAHGETDARFLSVETGYVDEQTGGTREVTGTDGVYVANVDFDRAGEWGVRIDVTSDGHHYDEFPFTFPVRERSDEPMIGDAAPPSVQETLATQPDITQIDSSSPPRAQMHDTTIRDAVMSNEPSVIAFATPAFCTSRLCAPVMDTVMDPLAARYGGRVTFVHVEPYALRDFREGFAQNPVPAAREWGIQSEPWIFVVGSDGRVTAKFEGIIALEEVQAALDTALAP